ncbi:sensor histidine kinase [Ferruginibacter sp. SUN106]|uniref:sensor histidine kinase n=1 Tax=Ferruginibacter sp. SUN106 TaxID=2978348 RepID=UPI003D35EC8E
MLKKHSFLALFILLQFSGIGQTIPDSNYIDIALIRDSVLAVDKTLLFFDTANNATIENLPQQKFLPFDRYSYIDQKHIPGRLVSTFAYLQIGVSNSAKVKDTVSLFPGALFDKILFYEKTSNGNLKYTGDGSKYGFCNLILKPNEKKVFFIKLDFCRHDFNYLKPQLVQLHYWSTYASVARSRSSGIVSFGYLMSGMLFLMLLFIVVNYILNRKKEFLYYFGYALLMFLLVLLYAITGGTWGSFPAFLNGYLDVFLLIMGNVFYLAFSRHFLNTKNNYTILDKVFRIEEWLLVILLLAFTVTHYLTEWYLVEAMLESLMKYIVLSVGILFIIIAFKQKQKLIVYLALGSAFAIFFSIVSLTIILMGMQPKSIFFHALFYHDIALVFAMSFFLLGLTYKNRRELVEKIQEQESLKLDVEKKDFEKQIAIIKAQQEERNRISADMHDDLGAGMTTIRLYSELAKSRIGDNTSIPEIEKISSSANELLNKMNAIIWSMSSSNDSLGNMVAYIRSYSLEYFEDSGVNCRISIPDGLPNIVVSGEIRRNVFLVVKEALNNVLKHSRATEVTITLERVTDGLKLLIQDNGTGIDFDKLRQFGNGLKNMKKRMEDIGINFSIENNNGTLITLHRVINDFNFSS